MRRIRRGREFAFACGALIAPAAPAPVWRNKRTECACNWLSESIKKLAEVTIFSPGSLLSER